MKTNTNYKNRKSGFSLVEVLVSLVIVTVIIAAVLPMLSSSVRRAQKNKFENTELSKVQNELEEEIFVSSRGQSYIVNIALESESIALSGELITKNYADGKRVDMFLRNR